MAYISSRVDRKFMVRLKLQIYRQVFVWMGMLFLFIFSYIPMVGIIIAFKDYKLATGFTGFFTSQWVGFKYFIEFFNELNCWQIVRNTVVISLLKLVFTFPVPIILAITLNEVRRARLKRVVQTVSYLPHFISWVVVSGILFSFLNSQNGLLNQVLLLLGITEEPLSFLSEPKYFWPMLVISDIWKGMGWWAIIFLAAITGVDLQLYEAAIVDGAGRLQRIWYITLPSIKGTIMIVLILSLGNLLGGGLGGSNFDQCYLLGNPVNYEVSEIIQTYVLKMGLAQGRYSFAAAIGLLQSVISLILIYSSNYTANKISGVGLF
ncbi:MAG: sugar ABC transporter permease [Clostridiales bacterium]|jgi:putative aldouronate transport system permease protein|nr:sugar ABC transporter permease [Clostridiales bacterium]